jgi:hypothetical protein
MILEEYRCVGSVLGSLVILALLRGLVHGNGPIGELHV